MKSKIVIVAGLIAIVLAGIAVKILFFPPVKDAYFALNFRSLQQAPGGLVILRPTHYPFLRHAAPLFAASPHSQKNFWIVGRNAPLNDVIAVAYDWDPSRVVLPSDARKSNFDFLVTRDDRPREQLQAVIRRKLGWQAHAELREVAVLALKVVNPDLPGLKVSDPDSPHDARNDDVKINFTNLPVSVVCQVLKRFYGISAIDKTGLTNFYDYSLPLPVAASRRLSDDANQDRANEYIKNLGLGLEPDKAIDKVLVLKTGPPLAPVLPDKKQALLGPLNPGAEEGSEQWYYAMDGTGKLLTDSTDAASGDGDFTIGNTSTNRHDHAEWRCEMFSLGSATNGAHPVTFSFDYKLPGPVKDGDDIRVQLRFFDQNTNFIGQKLFWVGSSSHDSAMTGYKTVATKGILPPQGARICDITLSANVYDGDRWSSGIGRFDNIFVTTESASHP